jgi:hypothetical protein
MARKGVKDKPRPTTLVKPSEHHVLAAYFIGKDYSPESKKLYELEERIGKMRREHAALLATILKIPREQAWAASAQSLFVLIDESETQVSRAAIDAFLKYRDQEDRKYEPFTAKVAKDIVKRYLGLMYSAFRFEKSEGDLDGEAGQIVAEIVAANKVKIEEERQPA